MEWSGSIVIIAMLKFFLTLVNLIAMMNTCLSIFQLVIGTIGVIYSFYELHQDIKSKRKQQEQDLLHSNDIPHSVNTREHA